MATRIVEWKKPYTWGKAIDIDENKVISLRLREENNLIIWDEWDNEIYVDLQLPDGIEPLDAFPVWITVWRVLVADDWDVTWTLACFKTTSWDNIKLLYGDNGKVYIDNGTGLFKQIYLKGEVDALLQALRTYVDAQLALKQDKLIAGDYIEIDGNVISAVIPTMSRFLSIWNASSWEPISFPASTPFLYTTGDYYLIEWVGVSDNYRPAPIEYDGSASTIPETDEVADGDVYIYDWAIWLLQSNHGKTVTFANIAGDPYDNTNLSTALNAKQDTLVNQSNIKSINNNSLLGSWNLSISEVPSWWTNWQVLTKTSQWSTWQNPSGWSDIEYVTQAEYTALLPWAASDGKHYFIYTSSTPPAPTPWQPWANTIAYYPLDSTNTVNDLSWNNYTLATTHTSPTFWTYQWVDCASFNWSSTELQTASVNPSVYWNQFTISFWLYSTATNTDQIPINNTYYWWGYYNWCIRAHSSSSYYYSFNLNCNSSYKAWDGWSNLVFTYDNGTIKSYTNWVYNNTWTLSLSLSNNWLFTIGTWHDENGDSWYCWYNWGLSNIIVEDKVWTAQEVSDYFNATKWDYWIS